MLGICKIHLRHARDLWADRKGISALEYGVLAVGTLVAVAGGATLVGARVTIMFNDIVGWLTPG